MKTNLKTSSTPGSADVPVRKINPDASAHLHRDGDVHAPGTAMPPGWHTRGYLPHYDNWEVIQMVTYRLADALPSEVATRLARAAELEDDMAVVAEEEVRAAREAHRNAEYRKRIEAYLDAGNGACWLKRSDIASIVVDSLNCFQDKKYKLHSWVIMPNHVHVLVEPLMPHTLTKIVQAWKSFTAREINRKISRKGRLWQEEYWDRFMRNGQHYRSSVNYIMQNPVKAGLVECAEDWPWVFPPGAQTSPSARSEHEQA